MSAVIATIAGIAGILLSLSMALPQSVVIWRERSRAGVSVATWLLFSLSFSTWVGYSLRVGNHVVLVSNILAIATAASLLVGTLRADGWPRPRSILAPVVLVGSWVALALHGYFSPIALVAPVLLVGSAVRIPQVIASARTARRRDRSDVSTTTWWVSFYSGIAWLLHAVLVGDLLVALSGITILVTSAGVLAFEKAASVRASAVVEPS